jgi:hypothetical protein
VFNPHTPVRNDLILGFLRFRQLLPTQLFMRHRNLDAVERETDEAKVLQ